MSDPVRELYSEKRYPALSHAETHPALLAVAARMGGLVEAPMPDECRVLELGCASGHNLLPLAAAYPRSEFTGIDFSDTAIRAAKQAAEAAGLANIRFEHADLRDWEGGEDTCDFLIAHGLLSWIPDEAKAKLFQRVARVLAPGGVASIDFNTLPGWALRQEAAQMVAALAKLHPGDLDARLAALQECAALGGTPHAENLAAIFADMRRKGGQVLPFDELAPVCDPLHFGQVVHWAGQHGLRYLGETTLAGNFPEGVAAEAVPKLQELGGDPVMLQQTLDLLSGRTHRTSLFCPAAAALDTRTTASVVLHFCARLVDHEIPVEARPGELVETFHQVLSDASPSTVPVADLMEASAGRLGPRWEPERGAKAVANWLFQAARLGWVELRVDPVAIEPVPPERPELSPLNLHFARNGQPLVDGYHRTCGFPQPHQAVVAALDGSRDHAELAALARDKAPDLHFEPWLVHLAARGMF